MPAEAPVMSTFLPEKSNRFMRPPLVAHALQYPS